MAERPRARDEVTIAPGHSPRKAWRSLVAAVVVALAALFVLLRSPAPPASPEANAPPAVAEAPPPAPPAPSAPRIARAPERATAPMRESPPEPAPAPEEAPPPDSADAPTVPSGIGLFPPRGSDPVRVGIVVPEDFALPDGFMRHYQVTDDGQDVAPILVVHPDYELLDAQGQPVPRPEGGVVPPELAPPGMPIETLVVPEPPDESRP